jgi:hypothetical protein
MSAVLLSIYIALIFIRPMDWWEPVMGMRLVNYAAIATLLVAFPRIMNEHTTLWREVPQTKIAYTLLVAASLSWIYPRYLTGILLTFQEFGKVIVLFFLILLLGREPRNFRILLWTVLLCVGWMSLHGILQIHRGEGFGGQEARLRRDPEIVQIIAFGIFHDPNDLCLAFIIALPLLWAVFRASATPPAKIAALGMMPLVAYAAWLTQSRGGIVGVFGMLAAYAIGRTKGIRRYLIASASITLVTVVLPARGAQLGLIDYGRVVAWGDGIAAWQRYPIFGVGWGDFPSIAAEKAAHNSYVEALTELGLIGYIPWFLLIYLTMIFLRRTLQYKNIIDRQDSLYLAALFSALAGYLTAIYFLSRAYNHVLYILLALATCQTLIACRDPNLYMCVFGPWRQDIKRGAVFSFASVMFIWVTVRVCWALAGE